MQGMDRNTGVMIDDLEHLKQSIVDILSTPIGSRIMVRDYGSALFSLLDRPINKSLFADIYAAVADALGKWEPRFKLEKINIVEINESKIRLSLTGNYVITQQTIEIKDLII